MNFTPEQLAFIENLRAPIDSVPHAYLIEYVVGYGDSTRKQHQVWAYTAADALTQFKSNIGDFVYIADIWPAKGQRSEKAK